MFEVSQLKKNLSETHIWKSRFLLLTKTDMISYFYEKMLASHKIKSAHFLKSSLYSVDSTNTKNIRIKGKHFAQIAKGRLYMGLNTQ